MVRIDIADHQEPQFGFLDMLFPAQLLDRTNWRDNPLVIHCERVSGGMARYVVNRLLQLMLFSIAVLCFVPFFNQRFWFLVFLCIPSFVFMCLRYHLFAKNQSLTIDMLSRDRIAEILLTDLGNNELFLHFLLLNCWNLGVFVVVLLPLSWFLLPCVARNEMLLAPVALILFLAVLVAQTWLAAIYQFTLEWKWFAGAPLNRFRPLISLGVSLLLTAAIIFINACVLVPLLKVADELIVIPLAISAVSAVVLVYIFQRSRLMNANAVGWLGRNLDRVMPQETYRLAWPDMLLPNRWANPFKAREDRLGSMKRFDLLMDGFLYGGFFSVILVTFPVTGYFFFRIEDFFSEYSWVYLASIIWPVFIMAAIGIYHGQALSLEEHPIAPRRMNQALFGLGVAAIAAALLAAVLELLGSDHPGSMQVAIDCMKKYIENITYGLIALACGVKIAHRRRCSANLPIMFMTLAALAFLFVQKTSEAGTMIVSRCVEITMELLAHLFGSFAIVLMLIRFLEPLASFVCYWIVFKIISQTLEKLWTGPAGKPAPDCDREHE